MSAELTLQVNHDNNDFWRYNSGFQLTPTVLRAGRTALVGVYQGMGLRFVDITIPQGVTIEEAYLIITCSMATSDICKTRISAEDVDNSGDFSGDDAGSAATRWLARTTARVDWDFAAGVSWALDGEYDSPELKAIIQEIVNREGWESGNAIVIFWNDWDERTTEYDKKRQTYPYNVSAAKAVQLYIKYLPVPPPTVTTNPATAIR